MGFSVVKNLPANVVDTGDANSIPGMRRSPGGKMATHFSILTWKNTMDRGAWQGPWGHKESDRIERLSTHVERMQWKLKKMYIITNYIQMLIIFWHSL